MKNQLQTIVKESGLDSTKAKIILEQFKDYFDIAAEWEVKAKAIIVTKADQTVDMQMARTGRLFLRQKRIDVENARKKLKEQALREGKAIDGIANVLKALIVPLEEHLEQQEKFVEIQAKKKEELMRLEVEKRMAKEEEERIEKDKIEQERIRIENKRLKEEAEERERKFKKQQARADAQRKKEQQERDKERAELEEKARVEREKQEAILAEIKAIAEKEQKKQQEKILAERKKAEVKLKKQREANEEAERQANIERKKHEAKLEEERKEKERLAELLANEIECPKCGHKFPLKK